VIVNETSPRMTLDSSIMRRSWRTLCWLSSR
jgi:hypothetical protein